MFHSVIVRSWEKDVYLGTNQVQWGSLRSGTRKPPAVVSCPSQLNDGTVFASVRTSSSAIPGLLQSWNYLQGYQIFGENFDLSGPADTSEITSLTQTNAHWHSPFCAADGTNGGCIGVRTFVCGLSSEFEPACGGHPCIGDDLCDCAGNYEGDDSMFCPANFLENEDCFGCAPGFRGDNCTPDGDWNPDPDNRRKVI